MKTKFCDFCQAQAKAAPVALLLASHTPEPNRAHLKRSPVNPFSSIRHTANPLGLTPKPGY
jgi:hypothetical protein